MLAVAILAFPDPLPRLTLTRRYLTLHVSEGCLPANRLYVVDMQVGAREGGSSGVREG